MEVIEIAEGQYRTKRLNAIIHYILQEASKIKGKKKDKSEINRICPV